MKTLYVISMALLIPILGTAAPISVLNPGFKNNSVGTPFNEFTFGAPAGWDLYDPGTITSSGDGPDFYVGTLTPTEPDPVGDPGVYAFFPAGAPEGNRVAIAFNNAGTGGQGEYGLVQTLTDVLTANTDYTLRVLIGNIASGTAVNNAFFNLDGFPGYRVDLLAGGVVVAQDNSTLSGSIPEGEWAESVVNLSTGASHSQLGQALGIRLVSLNLVDASAPAADIEVDFDDVRLNAVLIPEPSTLWLMSGAGLSLVLSRFLRRRNARLLS